MILFRDTGNKTVTEEKFTVVFHAILSEKMPCNKKMAVVIRGENPVFDGWDEGGKVVNVTK